MKVKKIKFIDSKNREVVFSTADRIVDDILLQPFQEIPSFTVIIANKKITTVGRPYTFMEYNN